MGLLSDEILIRWGYNTKTRYINKGYSFTNIGDEIIVKVKDLSDSSREKVLVKCDNPNCLNPYLKPMTYDNYRRCVHEDGKYYCRKCAKELFAGEKTKKTRLKNGKSFEQWCIENNGQNILDRWDYELNDISPSEITYSNGKKYYLKCQNNIHKSELKKLNDFVNGCEGSILCKQCNSFSQWCKNNNRLDILDRWDYNLNKKKPEEINYSTVRKYYFKCPKEIHKSELKNIQNITSGQEGSIKCKQCNSFAQWGIDNIREDFLDKYWSDKNIVNPWKIDKCSPKIEIFIKCDLNINHDDYATNCNRFTSKSNPRCPHCNQSKGEKNIDEVFINKEFVKISLEDFHQLIDEKNYFITQMKFKGLIGVGNGLLSYDFYVPIFNLLIEYQGKQHDRYIPGFHKNKKDFKIQLEHDRRKREYAQNNNINLLEIWYYDFDNIEQILNKYILKMEGK